MLLLTGPSLPPFFASLLFSLLFFCISRPPFNSIPSFWHVCRPATHAPLFSRRRLLAGFPFADGWVFLVLDFFTFFSSTFIRPPPFDDTYHGRPPNRRIANRFVRDAPSRADCRHLPTAPRDSNRDAPSRDRSREIEERERARERKTRANELRRQQELALCPSYYTHDFVRELCTRTTLLHHRNHRMPCCPRTLGRGPR